MPGAQPVLREAGQVGDVLIVKRPIRRAAPEARVRRRGAVEPSLIYADLTASATKGPMPTLPGFDITSYWARSLPVDDARCRRAADWPVSAVRSATAVGLYSAIVTALTTGTHRQLARMSRRRCFRRRLVGECVDSGGACGPKFYRLHDRKHPQMPP